jgi:hypothetical protein
VIRGKGRETRGQIGLGWKARPGRHEQTFQQPIVAQGSPQTVEHGKRDFAEREHVERLFRERSWFDTQRLLDERCTVDATRHLEEDFGKRFRHRR